MRYAAIRCPLTSQADWRTRAASARLTEAEALPGLLLFVDELSVESWPGGVLLGDWHPSGAQGRGTSSTCSEPGEAIAAGWGAYLLVRGTSDRLEILRDPSGGLPCYHVRGGGTDLLVPDAATARALGALAGFTIDEHYLRHWLQYPYLRTGLTGVSEVEEIIPGAARQWSGTEWQDCQLWLPASHAARRADLPFEAAAQRLRLLLLDSVEAQLTGKSILLQLSGGLDSSILAAALAERGVPFHAATFATFSPDGDERRYAAAVAERCGVPLEVAEEQPDAPLRWSSPFSFQPGPNLLIGILDEAMEAIRARVPGRVLVDGGGGDNLFGYSATAAPGSDALLSGHWGAISDIAALAGRNWWAVLGHALRGTLPKADRASWPEDRRFLQQDMLLQAPDAHPWLRSTEHLRPGKREHVRSLLHIQHFLDRHASGPHLLHPLYAQPLMEFCLSCPSWLAVAGGRDRAVARAAFSSLLPPQVANRRTKGSMEGLFHRRFRRHAGELRERLLDGELARRGLLDREQLAAAFRDEAWLKDHAHVRLSEIATLESWLETITPALRG